MTGRPRTTARRPGIPVPSTRAARAAEKERREMGLACAEARRLVGATFREARLAAGVTQREVHERTGIDIASLSRIENGQGNPSLDTLAKMARAIGRTLPDLFAPRP